MFTRMGQTDGLTTRKHNVEASGVNAQHTIVKLCVPCCRPGAGQCSCSHPAVSGQLWPGEGGWLGDIKTQTHLFPAITDVLIRQL